MAAKSPPKTAHLVGGAPPKARDQPRGGGWSEGASAGIPRIWDVQHAGLPSRPDNIPPLRTSRLVSARADAISKRIWDCLQSRSIEARLSSSDDGNNVAKCRNADFCKFTIGLYAAEDDGVLVEVHRLCGDCISFMKDCRAILCAAGGKAEPSPSEERPLCHRLPVSEMKFLKTTYLPPMSPEEEIFGASERSSGSRSTRSTSPMLSMDLRLEEEGLDGGGFLSTSSSDDIMIRLESAELDEDIFLPDSAATASAALKAEWTSTTSTSNGPPPSNQQGEKIEKLTSKMEELSTSDEIALLDEQFSISSSEWLPNNDVEQVNSVDDIPPMLFNIDSHLSSLGSGKVAVSQYSESPTRIPGDSFTGPPQISPLAPDPIKCPPECQAATTDLSQNPETWLERMQSSSPRNVSMRNSLATYPPSISNPETKACQVSLSTSSCSSRMPPKTSTGKKKKARRPRQLDMTHAVEATDRDILFGKGGKINKHPGNVYFRERAREFLPWYMQSSKEEKEKIADLLLESVESEGRRFLEKNERDGLYYKVVRGQHIKATATLRDLKKKHKKEVEI